MQGDQLPASLLFPYLSNSQIFGVSIFPSIIEDTVINASVQCPSIQYTWRIYSAKAYVGHATTISLNKFSLTSIISEFLGFGPHKLISNQVTYVEKPK